MREPPLRVLMTTDAVGGVWSYGLELALGLRERGMAVTLATLGPTPSAAQRARAASLGLPVHCHEGALEWMDDPWEDVERAGAFLQQLAHDVAPHIVHLNGYAHAQLDFGAPKLVVAHSCVLSWWRAVEREAAPARYARYQREVARGLASADLVVAPTEHMLQSLRENYPDFRCGRVIYNGRDHLLDAVPDGSIARAKQPLVFCAARLWDRAKNAETLARAAQGLAWPVYLAGQGELEAPNVHRLGWLEEPELSSWYARAAIYALPARYEPFGLSALEAAQAGCALVLGDIPSLREVWGDAAVYVDPNDAARLRRELTRLIESPPSRRELGRRARTRACSLGRAAMTDAYVSSYQTLLGRQAPLREQLALGHDAA